MICYMDRTFCASPDCATECDRRFHGTHHVDECSRRGFVVATACLRDTFYCKGYTPATKEAAPCSATVANTAPAR